MKKQAPDKQGPPAEADKQAIRAQSLLTHECAAAFKLAHKATKKLVDFIRDHECERRGHEEDICPCCDQSTAPFCSQCEILGLLDPVSIEGPDANRGLGEVSDFLLSNTPMAFISLGQTVKVLAGIQAKLLAKELDEARNRLFGDDEDEAAGADADIVADEEGGEA